MNSRKILLTLNFLLISTVMACASPLTVRVSIGERSSMVVVPKHLKNPAVLVLSTKIINTSNVPQKLHLMSCSYGDSWIPSSKEIFVGLEACKSNEKVTIILKPKEEYSRPLLIAITSKAKAGALSFQLGLSRRVISSHSRIGTNSKHTLLKGVVWSNHVRVRVKHNMLPFLMEVSDKTEQHSKKDFESLMQGKIEHK